MNQVYNFFAKSYAVKEDAKEWVKDHSPFLIGLCLLLFGTASYGADSSEGLSGILSTGSSLITDIVDFIMNVAVVMGVGAILYGLKLVYDKSNDRENVKNGHIVFSFVGGASLVLLWFIVESMAASISDADIGAPSSWGGV